MKDPADTTLLILTDCLVISLLFYFKMINQGSLYLGKTLKLWHTASYRPLPSKIPCFANDGDANVLKHMPRKLFYALFDLSGGKFNENVQLIYQDNAIYCFKSCYIYAHYTQSSHVMNQRTCSVQTKSICKINGKENNELIASQSQSILAISPLELIV